MRLAAIAALLIAGIFAGAQLGKIAPLVEWYQEVGFSLVLIGWLTSMIGVFVALAALPAGWAIELFGVRRSVWTGSAILAAGALALTAFQAPEAILAARLVEGIGYLILVIALPSVLTSISLPAWRAPVLAIWSCFVPVGYAISDLLAKAMLPSFEPSAYLLAVAAGYILFAGLGIALLPYVPDASSDDVASDAHEGAFASTLGLPVLLIALCFGFFVVQSVSFFSFMPAYLAGGGGLLLSAGAIVLFTPVGNVLASILVSGASARRIALIAAVFVALSAITAYLVFTGLGAAAATAFAVAFCIVSGVVGSALFAVIPSIVPKGGSVSIAIGLVAQAGGIGTLFGPPVAGWIIEGSGWTGLGVFLAAIGLAGLVCILPNVIRPGNAAT